MAKKRTKTPDEGYKKIDSPIIQMQLDTLLKEYASLRQEATHCDSTQMSLATTAFGFLTACFTLSGLFAKNPADAFLAYCVLPCLSMFLVCSGLTNYIVVFVLALTCEEQKIK